MNEEHKPTEIGVKCLNCSLHFTIWSWYKDRHNVSNLYCPECGQHHSKFMIWKRDLPEPVFTKVQVKWTWLS